jgi:hypothetical protein
VKVVPFRGKQAQLLTNRIRYLLDELENCLDVDGLASQGAVQEVSTFLVEAAWGDEQKGNTNVYKGLHDRITRRIAHNRDTYKLSIGTRELLAKLTSDSIDIQFSLGRIHGVTVVIPLTPEGMRRYKSKELAFSELSEKEIVPYTESKYRCHEVILSTVVHFPSIKKLPAFQPSPEEEYEFECPFPYGAFDVLINLLKHLALFLPGIEIQSESPPAVSSETGLLPSILCPISGKGLGEPNLETAGFRLIGYDKNQNKMYEFDFADINDVDTPIKRRVRMLETVALLKRACVRPV